MNRTLPTYEQQNPNQFQQVQINQQTLPQNPQQIQLMQQQQVNHQQQQIYTLSPGKNVRIEQQGSPCKIVNIQPIQQIQQIHAISKKSFYIPTSITPTRQRIVTQQVQSNSINSMPIQNPNQSQQNQQISFQQQNQPVSQPSISQNLQASSKPISQMPEKHRLLQQSHKQNLSQNQNNNNNFSNSNNNNSINLVGNGQISNHLNGQTKIQSSQGIQPTGIKTSIQRIKNKSEINLPTEFSQTPIQHIQTPQQMISLNNMYIQNSVGSPPTQNISISQNLFPNNIDFAGTPNNQNIGQASQFSDSNQNQSASFPHSIQSTTNNFSTPQTAVKPQYLKNQAFQERENSPYKYLQNQFSTNQKSPNMQSTNIGTSTQNSSQIPFVFSEEAAVGSINVGNSSSANRYVNKIQTSSPERPPQFYIKQGYQFNSGSLTNAYTPKANSNSISNVSQIGIPQQTKTSTEFVRSSSCNDVRKKSYRNAPFYQDSQFLNSENQRTLNITQNDRVGDRSQERIQQGISNDISIQRPIQIVNQSGSYINLPKTPTKLNPTSSSQNFQLGLLNSNSKKLRELEEQVKELVNENSKLSELLEEKGYLLQQIQDEQLVQKLLVENNELKEKLRLAQMENDLSIQNRVLHTENTNLNKILSEKVNEIRELKDKLQSNSQNLDGSKKVDQLERNIKLLIQENEHLSEVLKQRQIEVQKQRDENLEMQNKVINLQSYIQELQEQQSRQQNISNEKFNQLQNEFDKISSKLAEKESELKQKELNAQKIKREDEDQITKLVDENEKLNEIISQYINSSNTDLLNSIGVNKNASKNIVKEDEEKLMMYDSLQNCNKDYEEKIKNLVSQYKNLEVVILDLEKDKIELAENLQFMEDRQKVIEKQNDDLQQEIENLSKKETASSEFIEKAKIYENQNQDLQAQIEQINQELMQKNEENQLFAQQQEANKNYFEQIIQEKIEQINRLSQQLQEQSNFIEALQQQQTNQFNDQDEQEQEQDKIKKATNKKQGIPNQRYLKSGQQQSDDEDQEQNQQSNQNNNNNNDNSKSVESTFNQSNEENYFEKESEQLIETPLDSNTFEMTKYQKELKEKNDIIKNLCENLDFQKEQVSELNEKVQHQALFIIELQEKIKKSQDEINQQGEKILELLSNTSEDQSISKSQRKSSQGQQMSLQQNEQELIQQLEYKDHVIQEYILVIRELEDKIINLQKLLKELKPDIQLDTSFYIERLESLNLLSPNISNNLKDRKITQMDERVLAQEQQQDNQDENQQKQLINPQKIQCLIDREIAQFDQKYKQKVEELEKEMSVSISERDEKIILLINENQKLLQLNEQRLIELKILNQQIEMRKEQNFRDTKTIEDLQKKIQMMLSKNIQQNKGILKNSQHFMQNVSERSLIDSIREEESEESQDIDAQKNQQQHAIQSHETKRLQRKLEEKRRQLSEAKQELENLKEKLLDLEEVEFRLSSENRQLQEEIRRYSQQSEENSKLNEMLKTRKNEYTELKKRFEALRSERDDLIQKIKDSQYQEDSPSNNSKSFNVNSFEMYKEIEQIKKENHELKKINEQCIVQIKKKEKEINEKIEELDQVKNKCNELSEQIKTCHSAPQSFCTYQNQEDQKEQQIQKPRSLNNL